MTFCNLKQTNEAIIQDIATKLNVKGVINNNSITFEGVDGINEAMFVKNQLREGISEIDDSNPESVVLTIAVTKDQIYNTLENIAKRTYFESTYLKDYTDKSVEELKKTNEYNDLAAKFLSDANSNKFGEQVELQNQLNKDANSLYDQFEINENSDIFDLLNTLSPELNTIFNELQSRDEDVTIKIIPIGSTGFNPITKTVTLSLQEIVSISTLTNTPLQTITEQVLHHEMLHGASHIALQDSNIQNEVVTLFKAVEKQLETTPFIDTYRGGYVYDNGNPYALQYTASGKPNLDEFLAEVFSNPVFKEYVSKIKQEPSDVQGFWSKILEQIKKLFGIKSSNVYNELKKIYDSAYFIEKQMDIVSYSDVDPQALMMYFNDPNKKAEKLSIFGGMRDVLIENNMQNSFTNRIELLIDGIKKVRKAYSGKDRKGDVGEINDIIRNESKYKENLPRLISDMFAINNIIKSSESQFRQKIKDIEEQEKTTGQKLTHLKMQLISNEKTMLDSFGDYAQLMSDIREELLQGHTDFNYLYDNVAATTLSTLEKQNKVTAIRNLIALTEELGKYENNLEITMSKNIEPVILEWLEGHISESQKGQVDVLNALIATWEQKKIGSNDVNQVKFYNEKIKEAKKRINEELPWNKEYFRREILGEMGDINMAVMWTNSSSVSDSPLIQLISEIFNNVDITTQQLSQEEENKAQQANDDYLKGQGVSNLNTNDAYAPLRTVVTEVKEVDENGNITESIDVDYLKNEYTPAFITEMQRLRQWGYLLSSKRKELVDKIYDEKDPDKIAELTNEAERISELKQLQKTALNDFFTNETEQKESDAWWENEKLLDEIITDDKGSIKLREYRSEIYSKIQELEDNIQDAPNEEFIEMYQAQLDNLHIERKLLESTEGKDPNSKEYKAAIALKQYNETKRTMGSYLLTQSGLDYFNSKYAVAMRDPDPLVRKTWIAQNTKVQIKAEYFDKIKSLSTQLDEYKQKIATILGRPYNKRDSSFYEYVKKAVAPYRDIRSGDINPLSIPKETVVSIRDEQKAMEELITATSGMFALSLKERREKSAPETTEERKKELIDRENQFKTDKKAVETLLKEHNTLQKQLSQMSVTTITEEYQIKREDELAKQVASVTDEEVDKTLNTRKVQPGDISASYQIDNFLIVDKENDGVFRVINKTTNQVEEFSYKATTKEEEVESIIKRIIGQTKFETSEWYVNNHYDKVVYNTKGQPVVESTPIYIWQISKPSDPSYIDAEFPSFKYMKFVKNEKALNDQYVKRASGIPKLKKSSKYYNSEYDKLAPHVKTYVEYLRSVADKNDLIHDFRNRLGDRIPPALISDGEVRFETVTNLGTNVKGWMGRLKEMFGKTDQMLQEEGIITSRKRGEKLDLPVLFRKNRIESAKQSKDVFGLYAMDNFASIRLEQLSKIKTNMDLLLDLVRQTKKTEVRTIKNKDGSTTREVLEKTGESNRSKMLEEMMLTQMNGQRIKNAGNIGNVSVDKVMNKFMGFFALKTFTANLISPVVNTFGSKVQVIINAGVKGGMFSYPAFLWGQKEAIRLISNGSLASDMTKLGKKSYIGQMIDYFNAMPGSRISHLGKVTQWNTLKNFTEILTSPKDLSEYEATLSQFLAFLKYQKVPGSDISLLDAYTIDNPEKQLKLKDDINFSKNKELKIINKLHRIQMDLNGAYRENQRNLAQKYPLGRALFFMTQYLVPGFTIRFSSGRENIINEQREEGFYVSTVKYLNDLRKYGHTTVWNEMTDYQKHNLVRTGRELAIIMSLSLIAMLAGMGDKDDKDKSSTQKLLLVYLARISNEAQTWHPIYGIDDMLRRIQNPFIFTRTLFTARNQLNIIGDALSSSPLAYYQRDEGIHEKGDSKVWANFLKIFSGAGNAGTFDVESMYKVQKLIYKGGNLR